MRLALTAGACVVSIACLSAPARADLLHGEQSRPPADIPAKPHTGLGSSALRAAVAKIDSGGRPSAGVRAVGDRVRVEVLVAPGSLRRVERLIAQLGGQLEGSAGGTLVQALVPARGLGTVAQSKDVQFIRPPGRVDEPTDPVTPGPETQAYVGEEIAKTNAAAWQAAGITGAGVRVGIIDDFDQAAWTAAQAAGELPAPAGTFCRSNGAACNLFASGVTHGEGVSEIISEMAPAAPLYLATAVTTADVQAAVNYFAANGVRIISRSLTAPYDGPGNGTGPLADVINSAVAKGITWFNSAGNSAGRGGRLGAYWRGTWTPAPAPNDAYEDFDPGPGVDLAMGFYCSFLNGVRWSDWGANRTDYDVYVYDDAALTTLKAQSTDDQLTGGAPPIERPAITCSGSGDVDYLVIKLDRAGGGTAGDVLEFMTNGAGIEHFQNPFSASGPASDTASPGALSIGAVDPALGTAIAPYSSEGPTNDGRRKPDISAASCVRSFTFFTREGGACFNGTSAATPVAAGAAALALQGGLATTPAQLKQFMLGAVVDRGTPGPDELFGTGELRLPSLAAPPPPPPPPPPARPKADTHAPTVRALASHGTRGHRAHLRYRVSDDSRITRDTLTITRHGHRVARFSTPFGAATGAQIFVRWKVPHKTHRGRLRFCVRSVDRAGNRSATSCARLTIR